MDIESLFKPLCGQLVWNVHRIYGSIFYMEFGEPHLWVVREPIVPSPGTSPKVKRRLSQRRVTLSGDWTLSIEDAEWEIKTAFHHIDNSELNRKKFNGALEDIDGQRLLTVKGDSGNNSITLTFDLGGVVRAWPSIPNDGYNQWCLREWGADTVYCVRDSFVKKYSIYEPIYPKKTMPGLATDTVAMLVLVGGELIGKIEVAADADKKSVRAAALAEENVARHIEGKTVRRVIVKGGLVYVVAN